MTAGHSDARPAREVRYVVRCIDYDTASAKTRDQAERLLASIEQSRHCRHPHEIVEVPQ